jgi:Flavodoxin-like fold
MKNICFLNGSPMGKKSVSQYFLEELKSSMTGQEVEIHLINVQTSLKDKIKLQNDLEIMSQAEAIVICFPLYIYCMPGLLTRYLEEYHRFRFCDQNNVNHPTAKVYAIVNCGFPEPYVNEDALEVIHNFCTSLELNWRFGVGIAMGVFINTIKDISILKMLTNNVSKAIQEISLDIKNQSADQKKNIFVKPRVPKFSLTFMGKKVWLQRAHKNNLGLQDLYRRPYAK